MVIISYNDILCVYFRFDNYIDIKHYAYVRVYDVQSLSGPPSFPCLYF